MATRRGLSRALYLIVLLNGLLLLDSFVPHPTFASPKIVRVQRLSTSDASNSGEHPQRRVRQVRRKPVNRRPRHYWADIDTVKDEFRLFWIHLGVTPDQPPAIPSESLLNHFGRNDLRYAIVSYGGRKNLSKRLGGARIIPGKWTTAIKTSPEVQQLLRNATANGLSPDRPPLSPQQQKQLAATMPLNQTTLVKVTTPRWAHREGRKPKGYWTMALVIQEL